MKNNLWKLVTVVVSTMLIPGLAMLFAGCGPEEEEEVIPTPELVKPSATLVLTAPVPEQAATALPASGDRTPSEARLAGVTRWFYMINVNLEPEIVERIAASEYGMVVLDFVPSEENNTDYPIANVIAQLHNALHPKLVIAYIDIGQAEEYRTYWQPGWSIGEPEWIVALDPDGWEGNFPVAYWYDEWREIWLGEGGYLQAILDTDFDGVYLDWVEAYSDENVIAIAEREGVDPRQEMIWWVGDIADFARTQRPDFVVISQNAADLAEDDDYLAIFDAIAIDPQFVDATVPDVHLQPGSPCIDAGIDVGLPYLGLAPDMGASEFEP